ncbi:6-hydroxymethylpterin diphosphokinase MptE-like protein [Shewanella dokdonensis]|uniref:6-hydroxymethylpterin diphosphokinase MptE-like protein n=1 Tax=Shewanella dokdonensis TaxID=712036 RepID=UPI003CC7CB9D
MAGKLIAAGINPDFVITVDPKDVSFDVSRQVIQYSDKLLLVNAYHATNTIIGQWQGPKLYMGVDFLGKIICLICLLQRLL